MTLFSRMVGIVAVATVPAFAEEQTIPMNQVPEAVKQAILAKYPHAKFVEAEREVEDGETTYEIAVEDGDDSLEFGVSESGKILEIEKEIPVAKLPKAVAEALQARYPGLTPKTAEEVTRDETKTYEVAMMIEGKEKEVVFTPEGKVIDSDEDHKD